MTPTAPRSTLNLFNGDDESDYGSEFSPEEIHFLDQALAQANSEFIPSLAIVDANDEPGHGHFAHVPRRRKLDDQDGANQKEVFTQSEQEPKNQEIARLVSARLAGPPSFGPGLPFESEYHPTEFDDEALDTWEVWKDTLPQVTEDIVPSQALVNDSTNQTVGVSIENALRNPTQQDPADGRSPLDRFRTAPKKPLSVTDLVSPAWCELQYYFSLSRYGRVRPTVAMKRGSEVHAKLEEEVFTKVQIPVQSREDKWALQLWNLITSLRLLRESGMTREMQVWGIVQGQVVAGVIDELRLGTITDEAEMRNEAELDLKITNQALLTDENRMLLAFPDRSNDKKVVFLSDMKTRASKTIPRGPSLRGTTYQLMLYHNLVRDLVSHKTDFGRIFERYQVDSAKPFTDTFLEQMSGLDDASDGVSSQNKAAHTHLGSQGSSQSQSQTQSIEAPSSSFQRQMARLGDTDPAPSISAPSELDAPVGSQYSSISSLSPSQSFSQAGTQPSNSDPATNNSHHQVSPPTQTIPATSTPLSPSSIFHLHNTLASLLTLLSREVTLTFPDGASSLSPYLQASYRDKNTSQITGRRVFMYDEDVLTRYVTSEMSWWKGTRETKGVEVEEAFKCNMCEFAPGCGWRASMKDQEETRRSREKTVTAAAIAAAIKGQNSDERSQFGKQQLGYHQDAAQAGDEGHTSHSAPAQHQDQDTKFIGKIPGDWISENGSEGVAAQQQQQQRDGIEIGGGKRGQERSRSVV